MSDTELLALDYYARTYQRKDDRSRVWFEVFFLAPFSLLEIYKSPQFRRAHVAGNGAYTLTYLFIYSFTSAASLFCLLSSYYSPRTSTLKYITKIFV